MSGVRVLVGTRKGAFILTSDERRAGGGGQSPPFARWGIYHPKGSPGDPGRSYASQRPPPAPFNSCISCPELHTVAPRAEPCAACHDGV
ncbi:MAG TPA: hypothetical protein PKA95_18705, partial [Thermomicrobiales bacterium]|nr:hypothetical protein [Thermomicrobiales bacterium]